MGGGVPCTAAAASAATQNGHLKLPLVSWNQKVQQSLQPSHVQFASRMSHLPPSSVSPPSFTLLQFATELRWQITTTTTTITSNSSSSNKTATMSPALCHLIALSSPKSIQQLRMRYAMVYGIRHMRYIVHTRTMANQATGNATAGRCTTKALKALTQTYRTG